MSFLSDLEESLEVLWPLLEEHELQSFSIEIDRDDITVRIGLPEYEHVEATIDYHQSCSTVIKKLRKKLASKQEEYCEQAAECAKAVAAIKALTPSPLEELAQQADD